MNYLRICQMMQIYDPIKLYDSIKTFYSSYFPFYLSFLFIELKLSKLPSVPIFKFPVSFSSYISSRVLFNIFFFRGWDPIEEFFIFLKSFGLIFFVFKNKKILNTSKLEYWLSLNSYAKKFSSFASAWSIW